LWAAASLTVITLGISSSFAFGFTTAAGFFAASVSAGVITSETWGFSALAEETPLIGVMVAALPEG